MLYTPLKRFLLVALITGMIMETWLHRKWISFMLDAVTRVGVVHIMLTVLHNDVHFGAELCVASA